MSKKEAAEIMPLDHPIVVNYLRSERQWLHAQRIARARYELDRALKEPQDEKGPAMKLPEFWRTVLEVLKK